VYYALTNAFKAIMDVSKTHKLKTTGMQAKQTMRQEDDAPPAPQKPQVTKAGHSKRQATKPQLVKNTGILAAMHT
jgi:hypothetical protein